MPKHWKDRVAERPRTTLDELHCAELDEDPLVADLARVPACVLRDDRVQWVTEDGRTIEAHRYPSGRWIVISHGEYWAAGGHGGAMGSCMSRTTLRSTARDLVAEHRAAQQLGLPL